MIALSFLYHKKSPLNKIAGLQIDWARSLVPNRFDEAVYMTAKLYTASSHSHPANSVANPDIFKSIIMLYSL